MMGFDSSSSAFERWWQGARQLEVSSVHRHPSFLLESGACGGVRALHWLMWCTREAELLKLRLQSALLGMLVWRGVRECVAL